MLIAPDTACSLLHPLIAAGKHKLVRSCAALLVIGKASAADLLMPSLHPDQRQTIPSLADAGT
jgi:hypothetical protein